MCGQVPYSRGYQIVCWKGADQNFAPWNGLQAPDAVGQNFIKIWSPFSTHNLIGLESSTAQHSKKCAGEVPYSRGYQICVLKRGRSKLCPMKWPTGPDAVGRISLKFWSLFNTQPNSPRGPRPHISKKCAGSTPTQGAIKLCVEKGPIKILPHFGLQVRTL